MDKIKRYLDCYIPTENCNLRCHYCYITQQRLFSKKIASFDKSSQEIRKALSKERLGGVCLINLCAGGETLLSDEVLPLVKELLLEGHYVMLVTNGTVSKRFEEIAQFNPDLLKHLFIKFSFHYLELKRLDILDKFFNNIQLMKDHLVSFTVEITPSDELIPHIEDIKDICYQRLGALCHITIARDDRTDSIDVLSKYSWDEYKRIWKTFDSPLFEYKSELFYKKREEFCYAGDWSLYVNLGTGNITKCYSENRIGNIYANICEPLQLEAVGSKCRLAHCYNGHSFLALGDIPELCAPTYAQLRNRVCADGSEWLQPEVKAFFSSKLYESNEEYSEKKKKQINRTANGYVPFTIKVKSAIYKVLPDSVTDIIDKRK